MIPVRFSPVSWSFDPRRYVRGFAGEGHDVLFVAAAGSEGLTDLPVTTASETELESSAYWSSLRLDLAVVFTWMRFSPILAALRDAGVFTVSRGDTDGLIGVRVHPRATFDRMFYPSHTAIGRARGAWYWLKKYAILYRLEDGEMLETIRAAHATIVETSTARQNLLSFLQYYQAESLSSRVHVVPPPISHELANCRVPANRSRAIISVGRWNDPQKNGQLLCRTLRRLLRDDPGISATVVGPGGADFFPERGGDERVDYLGEVPHDQLPKLFGASQVCLVTSRWEGCHQASHEALAAGCSVVGTDIPVVREFASGGFGRYTKKPRSRELTAALRAELRSWKNGERVPGEIAAHWRTRTEPTAVAASIAGLMHTFESSSGVRTN